MEVVMRWVLVGVVGWAVLLILLLLLPGVRQRLQEHVLRRDWAERNKTSSGSEEKRRKPHHVPIASQSIRRCHTGGKTDAEKSVTMFFSLKLNIYRADPALCLRNERDLAWQSISWGSEEASIRWNIGACFYRKRNTREQMRHSKRQHMDRTKSDGSTACSVL